MTNTWKEAERLAREDYKRYTGHDYDPDPDTTILFWDKFGIPSSNHTLYFQLHNRQMCRLVPGYQEEYMKQKKELERKMIHGEDA